MRNAIKWQRQFATRLLLESPPRERQVCGAGGGRAVEFLARQLLPAYLILPVSALHSASAGRPTSPAGRARTPLERVALRFLFPPMHSLEVVLVLNCPRTVAAGHGSSDRFRRTPRRDGPRSSSVPADGLWKGPPPARCRHPADASGRWRPHCGSSRYARLCAAGTRRGRPLLHQPVTRPWFAGCSVRPVSGRRSPPRQHEAGVGRAKSRTARTPSSGMRPSSVQSPPALAPRCQRSLLPCLQQ